MTCVCALAGTRRMSQVSSQPMPSAHLSHGIMFSFPVLLTFIDSISSRLLSEVPCRAISGPFRTCVNGAGFLINLLMKHPGPFLKPVQFGAIPSLIKSLLALRCFL